MIRLRTCTAADTPHLVQSLNECLYQGYRFRVVMTAKRFLADARAHDVDLGATVLAFDGASPVGVALAARRAGLGWIAGMGVHPSLRGRGLGSELLLWVKERLRAQGVREILLEVLVDNGAARRCYDRAGFVARRRYDCFRGTAAQLGEPGAIRPASRKPAALLAEHSALHQAEQCWQRNLPTLTLRGAELSGLAAIRSGETLASLLTSESAIQDVGHRPAGPPLGALLPPLLHQSFGTRPFAIVNVPDDDPLHALLKGASLEVYAEQLDMRCSL